jgi:uncharacterized protein (UPF0262 family)
VKESLIRNISLNSSVVEYRSPEVEFEYRTAVSDLLRENFFKLLDGTKGPYEVELGVQENRIIMNIAGADALNSAKRYSLPVSPFKKHIKDYFIICDSYYKAIRNSNPSQIETIDMAKRSLHNEGAETMKDMLLPQIEVDFDTSRRLFTLVCVLHVK